ncbi:hypothetical protein I4U23_001391 [Adineta vaga]|nr:hypothetical protein I4U23_001391 [Adineta vaga]
MRSMATSKIPPESSKKCQLKKVLKFVSAVLIPLLLGAFTIIHTLQQESIGKKNRSVDLLIAAEEHEQNLALTIDEQRNNQLVAYINYISELLLAQNFSLSKQTLISIIHPKTLATLRQLDETRKVYLLRFLHESELITKKTPVRLSLNSANFSHIHLGTPGILTNMRQTSFESANLNNCSLTHIQFSYSDFTETQLIGASFIRVYFDYANLTRAFLQYTNFDEASIVSKADFTAANLTGANISENLIKTAGSISGAILPNGTKGRNRNLFRDSNCENLNSHNLIQQNISLEENRKWLLKIRPTGKLYYSFSGGFSNTNQLRMNLTQFNQTDSVVHMYCFKNQNSQANENRSCPIFKWEYDKALTSNYTDGYTRVYAFAEADFNATMVRIDIDLGEEETCRDVYFSIETR